MRLTLGHLLAQEELGLELVAGGDGAPDAVLAGAHPIEIEAPSRWLPPGWLMLTTGLRLRGRPDEQRRLVGELHEHGQAGLAWGIGLVVQQVPRAVLEEADRLGLPVVTVPVHVPFRDVIAYVNGSLVSDELYVMRRVVSMQDYLMDALGAEDPGSAILGRMAVMLEAGVVLLGADGQPVAQHGRPGPAAVAEVMAVAEASGDERAEAVLTGSRTLVAPITRDGRRAGWAGILLPERPFADQLARPVLRSAARLLGLLELLDVRRAEGTRRRRAEVLLASLAGPDATTALALAHDARALGLDPALPACGVVWVPGDATPAQALLAIEAVLERAGIAFLLVAAGEEVIGVVQGAAPVVVAAAVGAGGAVGVGRAVTALAGVPGSLADARAVVRHRLTDGPVATSFDELAPAAWLLASSGEAGGAARVAALLAPLRSHPRLLETLHYFFEADLDVGAAAAGLGLHPNTMRYRLRRIEALTGLRLASPEAIAGVHVALLGERLAGR